MNLQIKAVCKTAKIRRDNTCIIGIQYCFTNERRVNLDSGLSVPPQFWNPKKRCISESLPPEFGDCTVLNKKLIGELRKAEDIISLGIQQNENPLEFLKSYYKPDQMIDSYQSAFCLFNIYP